MSGSVGLEIITGTDWGVQINWSDNGVAIPFTNPTMDIRQELSPAGVVIARLDQSGTLDGTITIPQDGTLIMTMTAAKTSVLQTGRGFWDLFVTVSGARTRLVFGSVNIIPHVTAAA